MSYDRQKAKSYAKEWAYKRNPNFYDFDANGGDCTNFISQCLYYGNIPMNYKKDIGWYYNSSNDRSAPWSSVEHLYTFLINNKSVGPKGTNVSKTALEIGDIIQLSFNGSEFLHSLLVTNPYPNILLTAHTFDVYNKPLYLYSYKAIRFIHITD